MKRPGDFAKWYASLLTFLLISIRRNTVPNSIHITTVSLGHVDDLDALNPLIVIKIKIRLSKGVQVIFL